MTYLLHALYALVVGVLPGTVVYRLPVLKRDLRAVLPAEERWFWQIVLSLVWSVSATMALAAASAYSFRRLIAINVALVIALGAYARFRIVWLGLRKPTLSILLPLVLAGLGIWRFTPASEYIIGGKDPGVYVNEGINIDRTGTLFRRDEIVATVPLVARDLFFPKYTPTEYYGLRFMGVFLNDPTTGEVIPQFPHFLPASIALGYEIGGIRGATSTVVVWALLGLWGVYLFGARLAGRVPALAACVLLTLNVIETWYGKYPNAEVVMQTFVFAGLLALSRVLRDDDRFFGWVTGALAVALIFLRFDAYLAIVPVSGAVAAVWIVDRRAAGWPATVMVLAATAIGWLYYSGPMKAYLWQYRENLPTLATGAMFLGAAVLVTLALGYFRDSIGTFIRAAVPPVLIVSVAALAAYALYFRNPGGRLVASDAYALRTFRDFYFFKPALVAAFGGFALLAWKRFWREPAFYIIVAAFCTFFFYKIRVAPEHFWMARRFLPVILPSLLLLASAGAFGIYENKERRPAWRAVAATVLLAFIGWQYAVAAAPVASHVEYKGAIHLVDKLAHQTKADDLVIFEGRESDVHVMAVPLAYMYGRNVLVLATPRVERRAFESFLADATKRYGRVLFVASAGTDLLSRRVGAAPISFVTATLPEYATTAWDQYPAGPRQKDLGYSIYQLTLDGPRKDGGFVLDVGYLDEVNVLRFFARELTEGRTFRWTSEQSFIAVTGLAGTERVLTMVMHDGGRPAKAPPADIEVLFNEISLGTIHVETGFKEYRLSLPAEAVKLAADSPDPVILRLVTKTWNPKDYVGGTDDRALGVMIDRVEIH